ncbi:MAG: hypothetical protein KJ606_05905 [Chloroflexi bacterium]|nr:hypothetical protein [Chloroflexota bacterium]
MPIALILILVLLACGLPTATSLTPDQNAIYTAAAQTIAAQAGTPPPQITEAPSIEPTLGQAATQPPIPTNTLGQAATQPPIPTNTLVPSPTTVCDKTQFVSETVPDGTVFAPGATFTKTWRVRNVGACTWTAAYAIVFYHGDHLGAPDAIPFPGNVAPGQEVDLSINMQAPITPGAYESYWKFRNASGVIFVVNPYSARITVVAPTATTVAPTPTTPGLVVAYNFIDQAPSAEWIAGGASSAECPGTAKVLTFGGPSNDPCGFAMFREGSKVEGGIVILFKILEMHPKWVDDGVISGLFPVYTVQSGDHFRTQLGFLLKADGTCGVGNVVFQLNYKVGGTLHPLSSWSESCDGTLRSVDVDLSGIVGQSVQFAFAVMANGSSAQDWAVWIAPRVEH